MMILMLYVINTKNQQYCSLELKMNAVWMPYEDWQSVLWTHCNSSVLPPVMLNCSVLGTRGSFRWRRPTALSSTSWDEEWWAGWGNLESPRELLLHQRRTATRQNTPEHFLKCKWAPCTRTWIITIAGIPVSVIPILLTHTRLYIACPASSVK